MTGKATWATALAGLKAVIAVQAYKANAEEEGPPISGDKVAFRRDLATLRSQVKTIKPWTGVDGTMAKSIVQAMEATFAEYEQIHTVMLSSAVASAVEAMGLAIEASQGTQFGIKGAPGAWTDGLGAWG